MRQPWESVLSEKKRGSRQRSGGADILGSQQERVACGGEQLATEKPGGQPTCREAR